MIFDAPNINRLWAGLIVEELVRCGVGLFVLAPGSRSTPLVTAIAAHPKARHRIHFDERGTAFFALGYARATGRPAAWITTSGTAVANGLPAAVEASVDGIPLLLLTADRPPELRETGANQTIDQVRLFGDYVRWQFDLPAPTPDVRPEAVLTTVDQAVYRARRPPAGPVHLNCMFREPLAPDPGGRSYPDDLRSLAAWRGRNAPYTRYAASAPAVPGWEVEAIWEELSGIERGLVVAGRLPASVQHGAVLRLAERLGWPLLPDVGSGLRLGKAASSRVSVPFYDVALASEQFVAARPPEAVLHVGGRSTSKRLAQFLERHRPDPYVVVRERPSRLDPNHQVTHYVEADLGRFCEALTDLANRTSGVREADVQEADVRTAAWTSAWREASRAAEHGLARFFDGDGRLSEPGVARLVSQQLPKAHGLCLASSMPVRDMDAFAVPGSRGVPVASNRGASGIDGTVATAAGFAEGLGRPVTLVIGDLALLHDLNSLALLRHGGPPVIIVVLNNDGGGIFSFLPIAEHRGVFEPYFGTPHGLTFRAAADLFGLAYHHPVTTEAFGEAYASACAQGASALIEVTTERAANRVLHQELLEAVAVDAA